jgi:hypothetical protein
LDGSVSMTRVRVDDPAEHTGDLCQVNY